MPFLRAALLKKNTAPEIEQEEIIIAPAAPVVSAVIPEEDLEPEYFPDIDNLNKAIDEKVPAEETQEELGVTEEPAPEIKSEELEIVSEVPSEEPAPEFEISEPAENVTLPEDLEELGIRTEELGIDETPNEEPAPEVENVTLPEEIQEALVEENTEPEELEAPSEEPAPEAENATLPEEIQEALVEENTEPEEFKLKYDVTSGERYVDKVSTKTEFDKMLDELAAISKDLLSWQVEKFAKQYTEKFPGNEQSDSDEKKYEAFLGGYITNAAMTLYDNGYRDCAIKQLDQAKNILTARKKLEDETIAIKERVEEEDAAVDLSDILGMFGDG